MVDSVSFIQSLWLHWCVNESFPEAEFILGPAEPVSGSAKSQTLCTSVLCCSIVISLKIQKGGETAVEETAIEAEGWSMKINT